MHSYCCSVDKSCLTLCHPMDRSMPGFPILHYPPEFAQTHVHWVMQPSNHLILCYPFLLPSTFPSIRVFSKELALHMRWPKYWASNIRDWFPLRLTSLIFLLSKRLSRVFSSTTIWKHQFFSTQPSLWVQLSHPYKTTGGAIALTLYTFAGKYMSLLFNMLPRFIIAFLPIIFLTLT